LPLLRGVADSDDARDVRGEAAALSVEVASLPEARRRRAGWFKDLASRRDDEPCKESARDP